MEIGEAVGERIQGTFVGTVVRRARTVGLSPWVMVPHFERSVTVRVANAGGFSRRCVFRCSWV